MTAKACTSILNTSSSGAPHSGARAVACQIRPAVVRKHPRHKFHEPASHRRPLGQPQAAATADSGTLSSGALSSGPAATAAAVAGPAGMSSSMLTSYDSVLDVGSASLLGRDFCEAAYLSGRTQVVSRHYPAALGIDDFLHRMEIALYAYGFNGDNSIAMVDLCRDEVTNTLKHKLDSVFGSAFNTNGLGGVLTCGETGVAAGLSHAPVSPTSGKERYVFFSSPHISINAKGDLGEISRPGRPGASCACGALNAALVDIKSVHLPRDPEYIILKQRLARRLRFEGTDDSTVDSLTLVDITNVAERTITDDLEYLISHTVDPTRADYAVVAGAQIHNWGPAFDDDSPNLEYVAPSPVYAVVDGEKTCIDLNSMPSPTPRQVRLLAHQGGAGGEGMRGRSPADAVCNYGGSSTVCEIEPPYTYSTKETRRRERERAETYAALLQREGLHPQTTCSWPGWQSNMRAEEPHRNELDTSVIIDHTFESDGELDDMWARLQDKYIHTGHQAASDAKGGDSGGSSDDSGGGGGRRRRAAAADAIGKMPDAPAGNASNHASLSNPGPAASLSGTNGAKAASGKGARTNTDAANPASGGLLKRLGSTLHAVKRWLRLRQQQQQQEQRPQ